MVFLSVSMGVPFHVVRTWSAAEISLYMCYFNMSPWGEERADIRNAMQMQMTANLHRDTTRKSSPYTLNDFMPFPDKPHKTSGEPAGMRSFFKSLVKK